MNFTKHFFQEANKSISRIDEKKIEAIAKLLDNLRSNKGRLFIMGVGGSSANASHAVNDFRKLCNIETYCLTDNVSELTARTNDEGWDSTFVGYLKNSNLKPKDILMTFSVGGGNLKKKVSMNIVKALQYASKKKLKTISVLGKNDGYAAKNSTISIIFEIDNKKLLTPITESLQVLVWHYLVSSPILQKNKTTW
jgi:D-sedoheptulose 7-phosphate isomerase